MLLAPFNDLKMEFCGEKNNVIAELNTYNVPRGCTVLNMYEYT